MSHLIEQDRTGFFTVVGAPPIVEEHHDTHSHYHQDSFTDNKSVFVAGVWAALYAVILVVAIVGKNGVGRAVETVTALIH